jgi:amidase
MAYPHFWKAGSPPAGVGFRTAPPLFDALTATAHELQAQMAAGALKSTDLVREYVWRIEQHNGRLRAVAAYAPHAMARAREMDERRAAGEACGPLHGIPVLIKVGVPVWR